MDVDLSKGYSPLDMVALETATQVLLVTQLDPVTGNGGTNSKIVYNVTAGTTYYIEATTFTANAEAGLLIVGSSGADEITGPKKLPSFA